MSFLYLHLTSTKPPLDLSAEWALYFCKICQIIGNDLEFCLYLVEVKWMIGGG